MECPDCGQDHERIDSFPDSRFHVDELDRLSNHEGIGYLGPTAITSDMRTHVVAFEISGRVGVASYYEEIGWLITFELDDIDGASPSGETPSLVNEMASQAVENGYRCVNEWREDGEPGARLPNIS